MLVSHMIIRRLLHLVALCASTTALGQAALPLYLNTLENTFQNWSWIPNNFSDTTYVLPGFSNSISATANGDWQAISLGTDVANVYQGLNLSPYQNLVFGQMAAPLAARNCRFIPGTSAVRPSAPLTVCRL